MSEVIVTKDSEAVIAHMEVSVGEENLKVVEAASADKAKDDGLLQPDFLEAGNSSMLQQQSETNNKETNGESKKKRQLNQEDIEAVEFLASEFSKEIQTSKSNELKPPEMETIDSTMLEVASVQGVSNETDGTGQTAIVGTLQAEFEESQDIDPGEVLEPLAKKRKSRSEDREFKCGFCAKSFSMRIALEKHLVVHGAKLPWQCPDCAKGFMKSSDYKDHCNKAHDNYRPFPCHTCGKALSNLGILKNHQGLHSGERPYQCEYADCSKAFLTKTNLEDHHRKHVNAREFECGICHKRFNLKGDLRQHEKVHRQEKPFECEFCKMTFPRGPSLWRHRRTHTGEKPYACDICGKSFARMENCQEHRRIHTGERPLVCSVCGKAFRDSGNFSNHKKIHQEGYVPRKKRALAQKKARESTQTREKSSAQNEQEFTASADEPTQPDMTSQEVAFIVAPMQIDEGSSGMSLSVATSTTTEPSYVQVGNFLLTMEMEAAFRQLMQQHAGSNEFVTLAMTDGKGLELVSDPSQFGAIMQAATSQAHQGEVDLESHGATSAAAEDVSDVPASSQIHLSVVNEPTEDTMKRIVHDGLDSLVQLKADAAAEGTVDIAVVGAIASASNAEVEQETAPQSDSFIVVAKAAGE